MNYHHMFVLYLLCSSTIAIQFIQPGYLTDQTRPYAEPPTWNRMNIPSPYGNISTWWIYLHRYTEV